MPAAPPVVLTAFSGEQPRVIPRLMPETAAQSARDVRLDDGGLTPMRSSAVAVTGIPLSWKSIYNYLGTWIGWDNVVNAAPGPIAEDRLYYTGDGVPKMRIGSTIYPLAVPFPLDPLTAAITVAGAGDIVSRQYAYTYVTDFGEESEPSAISNAIDWKPTATVTLSGFLAAPAGRAISLQRIYRTQTGSTGTGLYFIAERPASNANFVDNLAVTAIAEPCPSISYNAPPDDLEGLIALPNGMMAAFVGKKLYFSEQYRPHAWPEKYILTMDYKIVGLGAMNVSIVVATEGQPYLVSGNLPENMTSQKIEQNLPCINKRSIVDLGYAIAYGSNEGIVVARADGSIGIASANIFDRDGWFELNPDTMIAAQLNGRYVSFYDRLDPQGTRERGALLLDLANPNFLARTATYARAVMYDIGKSALFYAPFDAGEVRQMDAPSASRLRLYWKSKEFVLPYPENYGAFIVDTVDDLVPLDEDAYQAQVAVAQAVNAVLIAAGSIGGDIAATPIGVYSVDGDSLTEMPRRPGETMTVGIYADKKLVAGVGVVNRAVRLPSGFRARTWEVDIYTDQRIYRMTMAKTMDDLKRQP